MVVLTSDATALVVEDDEDHRHEVVVRLSRRFGQVLEAPSAEMALYVCGSHVVDVVAASACLPGMGAEGLCAELVGNGGPPVVAYRIPGGGPERARWLAAGGADCTPSGDPALVTARCRAVLRRAPSGRHRRRRAGRSPETRRRRVRPGTLRWR
jgi:DNA-binding response OmpR family regulator